MFLQVTLGLLSLCARYEELVAEYGRPIGEETSGSVPGDSVLDFFVGLAAFSQNVLDTLRQAGDTEHAALPARDRPRSQGERPPLRRLLA